VEWMTIGDLGPDTDWRAALDGVEGIIHLAARVHLMQDRADDPLAAYRSANTDGTAGLARAAAAAGARRLVFLSTAKVHGERSSAPFREGDPPRPSDPYSISKWEAEQALAATGRATGLEWSVLRPPLVYGPGVGANFLRLLRLADSGLPLPFASIDNRRSLVFVENLADAAVTALLAPAAAGATFLVSDGEDVSTAGLIASLATAMGRPARLFPVPPPLLRLLFQCIGQGAAADRLMHSLQVDGTGLKTLGWTPPVSMDEGFRRTVNWYRSAVL
jgi:nucleoside-diphosphate-sugar epimerase